MQKYFDEDGNDITETVEAEQAKKLEENAGEEKAKLVRLLGDPDIQAMMSARDRGETVKVVVGDDKGSIKEKDKIPEIDVNDMDNSQLVQHMTSEIKEMLTGVVGESITPLKEELKAVKGDVDQTYADKAAQRYETMKIEHPYLDELKPRMTELYKNHPNLNLEQLRALAVAENESAPVEEKIDLATERPTSSSARPGRVERKVPLAPGKQGFDQLLKEAKDVIPELLAR